MNSDGARRRAITLVYLAGLLQGFTLVSFPASSVILKHMHGLSDAQYGAIFLPQVALAVLGALGGGALAGRLGLGMLLWIALAVNALSQLVLAATQGLEPALAYWVLLSGTALLGLGFGLIGAPMNSLPGLLFPLHRDSALVAQHTGLGLGLAAGPLLAGVLIESGHWVLFPVMLAWACFTIAVLVALTRMPRPPETGGPAPGYVTPAHPVRSDAFWIFAFIAVVYAFAEGTFYNWAVIYLAEVKQHPQTIAATALSVFWAAMVAGRLAVSVLVLRITPAAIWGLLPVLMIAAFLLLPYADSPERGIALFALAGLACSAFFPLSVGLASNYFERHVSWVSSMMIAALMIGVGAGSFLVGLFKEQIGLEQLYRLSASYPTVVLGAAILLYRRGGLRRKVSADTGPSG